MKLEKSREGMFKSDAQCPYCKCRKSTLIVRGNSQQYKCRVCGQFFTIKEPEQ